MKKLKREYEDYSVDFDSNTDTWSDKKTELLKNNAIAFAKTRTPEQKLRNQVLSIRFRMEQYLANEEISEGQLMTQEAFLKEFLEVLEMPLRRFSAAIEIQDSNLKKYLKGERVFNYDLAMKFGHFFHTPPEYWLELQIKNMLILKSDKSQDYNKYDYEKFIVK